MDEKKKKLIRQVRMLTIVLAAGVILLCGQAILTGQAIFQEAALGLTVFATVSVALILRRIIQHYE